MVNTVLIYLVIVLLMGDIVSTWWAVRISKNENIETNQLMRIFMKVDYRWAVLISFFGIALLVYIFQFSTIWEKIVFNCIMAIILDNNIEYIVDFRKRNY